jgi:hypothetical protein
MGLDQDLYLVTIDVLQTLIDIVLDHDTTFADYSSVSSDEEILEKQNVVEKIENVLSERAQHIQTWRKQPGIDMDITNICSFHNLYSRRGYGVYYGKSLVDAKDTIKYYHDFDDVDQPLEAANGYMFVYTHDY